MAGAGPHCSLVWAATECDACPVGALGTSFDDEDFEHAADSTAAMMIKDVLRTECLR
jgi:hypothetical protein